MGMRKQVFSLSAMSHLTDSIRFPITYLERLFYNERKKTML